MVRAGGSATGDLSVSGDQIVFGPNQGCSSMGRYEWRSDGVTLMLTSVRPDLCTRRTEAIDGPTYARTE